MIIYRCYTHTRNFELDCYAHTREEAKAGLKKMWLDWMKKSDATMTWEYLESDTCMDEITLGSPRMDTMDYFCPVVDDTSTLDRHNLNLRSDLMGVIDILKGAPTFMNDDVIEELIEQVKVAEDQLLQTCEGCGGERAHPELDEIILIPTNGWCAMELPECEVVA